MIMLRHVLCLIDWYCKMQWFCKRYKQLTITYEIYNTFNLWSLKRHKMQKGANCQRHFGVKLTHVDWCLVRFMSINHLNCCTLEITTFVPDEELLIDRRQKAQRVVFVPSMIQWGTPDRFSVTSRYRKHIHIPTGNDSSVSQSTMAQPCVWNLQQGHRNTSVTPHVETSNLHLTAATQRESD